MGTSALGATLALDSSYGHVVVAMPYVSCYGGIF